MQLTHRPSAHESTGVRPSRRRFVRPVVAAALIGLLAASAAIASTPVTDGYRDQAYGGGAFRPTGDKPQSKLWYTNGHWFAGMFLFRSSAPGITPKSEYRIYRLDEVAHDWVDTGTVVDTRDKTHGDYLWDEADQTLWVASASPPATSTDTGESADDSIKVFRYTYDPATGIYEAAAGFPVEVPNTLTQDATTDSPATLGGAYSVTIDRDSSGRLWAVWAMLAQVRYSISGDGGETWSVPAQVPTQADNPIRNGSSDGDIASVVAFGDSVGVAWSDHDALPAVDDGYYFSVIGAGDDPSIEANWSLEKLPTLLASAGESADNHINLKATSDGTVYMVGKTGKDTAACATNKQVPLIEFFRRTTAGTWSPHLVGTVGDCNTRAQLVVSEELDTAWVFLTSPNGGGTIYKKSAPLSGAEQLVFRGTADQTIQRGSPFIRSATETAIDDPTTTKQSVTAASGIVVLANNLLKTGTTNAKFYLHNEMSIAASDSTPPSGTVTIAAGEAFTATTAVTIGVPATDPGSGMSLVRLSNSPTTADGVLTTGTTYTYNAAIAWTLTGGDEVKTVYAQWRDAAGNWSPVTSDTIVLDTAAPTGTVAINGGAASTNQVNVTLSLGATDVPGSGVASVLLSNSTDFSAATPIPYAAGVPWTMTVGDGTKTVYVKFVDAVGNTSASPVTDTITLDTVRPNPGSVAIQGGSSVTATPNVSVTLSGVAGDATSARAANTANMAGSIPVSPTGIFAWTLAAGADGPRTVYVRWVDSAGNWSWAASDSITLNAVAPSGTVLINGGAAWTRTTAASLTFPSVDADVVQVRVGTSPTLAGAVFRAYTAGMTLPFTLPAGNGTKTVYAQFKDVGGNLSPIASDAIGLDATAPTMPSAPVHSLSNPVTTGINLHLAWSGGTDTGGSGFAGYVVQQSIDSGAWTVLGYPTAGALDVPFASSRNYVFRVASRDRAGNIGAWASSPVIRGANHSESSTAVKYSGSWANSTAASYLGGKAKVSSTRTASATFKFNGNQVAWLSRRSNVSGSARVYINGVLVATVNLHSTTTKVKQVVFTRRFSTVGPRTLKIVVLGTAGHPRVTVDSFFFLR